MSTTPISYAGLVGGPATTFFRKWVVGVGSWCWRVLVVLSWVGEY